MICEATSLNKYIDKSPLIYFIYGSEIVLKNESKKMIKKFLEKSGFSEKIFLDSSQINEIEKTIIENSSGSLFGSKTIIDIELAKGRLPDSLNMVFEKKGLVSKNIAIIINSQAEKISKTTKLIKKIDAQGLIIECKKLKSFEEKIWLKSKLNFLQDAKVNEYVEIISNMNVGNLAAQKNEIEVLKLLNLSKSEIPIEQFNDSSEFVPFELEDAIINKNTKSSLRILNTIKKNEDHYGPLLIWIIGKIINTSISAVTSSYPKKSLQESGVWQNKITLYLNFINGFKHNELIKIQKKVFELDLAIKGLSKKNFWNEISMLVLKLTAK